MYEIIKEPWSEEDQHHYFNSILASGPSGRKDYFYYVGIYLYNNNYLLFDYGRWSYKRKQLTQTKVI